MSDTLLFNQVLRSVNSYTDEDVKLVYSVLSLDEKIRFGRMLASLSRNERGFTITPTRQFRLLAMILDLSNVSKQEKQLSFSL